MTSHKMNSFEDHTPRNPAEYPILGILTFGPAHGYDVWRRLTEGIGSIWKLGRSHIYALLIRLERDGLVVHERIGQENLPARNTFRVTTKGREVFTKWFESPVRHVRDLRLEFLTKLWFAQQVGSECERRVVECQLSACREKVQRLEAFRASSRSSIERRSLEFRLTILGAAFSWLQRLSVQDEL